MADSIFHFRVLLDHPKEVFRDVLIRPESSFLEFHETVVASFGFSGKEMASFYLSNEDWDKGEEITQMDMASNNGQGEVLTMDETRLEDVINEEGDKLLYLYDFLRMWIFYIELISVDEVKPGVEYPAVSLTVGDAPAEDSKEMEGMMPVDFDPDLEGIDDLDEEIDFDNIDDYEEYH